MPHSASFNRGLSTPASFLDRPICSLCGTCMCLPSVAKKMSFTVSGGTPPGGFESPPICELRWPTADVRPKTSSATLCGRLRSKASSRRSAFCADAPYSNARQGSTEHTCFCQDETKPVTAAENSSGVLCRGAFASCATSPTSTGTTGAEEKSSKSSAKKSSSSSRSCASTTTSGRTVSGAWMNSSSNSPTCIAKLSSTSLPTSGVDEAICSALPVSWTSPASFSSSNLQSVSSDLHVAPASEAIAAALEVLRVSPTRSLASSPCLSSCRSVVSSSVAHEAAGPVSHASSAAFLGNLHSVSSDVSRVPSNAANGATEPDACATLATSSSENPHLVSVC
mmetsp:Transcript_53818/g.144095  ORF Transcript_53818/g.144095 Transcript_53818/m.144095 type:complete len:338 (+) Transcript_53818:226-1239(+)